MTYLDPALRTKRRPRAAWAREHLWRCCAHCDVTPGMLHSRYQAVLEGFKRAVVTSPGHSFLLLRPFRARQWLRAQGFDPSTPLGECDHIVPLWEGGTDDEDNLQLLCRPCHKAKTREEAVRKARMPKHHTAIADYEGSRG